MNETLITVVGYAATDPKLRLTGTGTRVVSFRLASTERRYDKALNGWRDGDTIFYTVTCWRNTGENALDSVSSGQPVVVHGRLRSQSYEKEGQARSVLEIEAYALGHDIARGVSRFTKATIAPSRRDLVPDDDEQPESGRRPDERTPDVRTGDGRADDARTGKAVPVSAVAAAGAGPGEDEMSPSAA